MHRLRGQASNHAYDVTDKAKAVRLYRERYRDYGPTLFSEVLTDDQALTVALVWDRLPAHRAKKVQAYLDTQKHWLTVEWFPGYGPELNPVEYMWSAAKNKDWANLCVDTVWDVDAHIRKGARRIRRQPELMMSFLKASTLFEKELST